MDNYPPGAANDKLAPYNEELDEDVEVLAIETIEREVVLQVPVYRYTMRHYDEDLPEYYKGQAIPLTELFGNMEHVLTKLIEAGIANIDGYSLKFMLLALKTCKPVGLEVTEK